MPATEDVSARSCSAVIRAASVAMPATVAAYCLEIREADKYDMWTNVVSENSNLEPIFFFNFEKTDPSINLDD